MICRYIKNHINGYEKHNGVCYIKNRHNKKIKISKNNAQINNNYIYCFCSKITRNLISKKRCT